MRFLVKYIKLDIWRTEAIFECNIEVRRAEVYLNFPFGFSCCELMVLENT